MTELVSIGGRRVAGFALGDVQPTGNQYALAVRGAATGAVSGAVLGGVVGSIVDYTRTRSIGWQTPAMFATVGAIGGAILGEI